MSVLPPHREQVNLVRRVIGQSVRVFGIAVTLLWLAAVPLALIVAARYIGLAQIAAARAADAGAYVEAASAALIGVALVLGLSITLLRRPDHGPWLISAVVALAILADVATISPTDRALIVAASVAGPLAAAILVVSLVGLALSLVIAPPAEPDRGRPPFMPPFAHHPN